jgi:mRNA-degrading endonuclease RelE of RelBE toxin-antitoxin system
MRYAIILAPEAVEDLHRLKAYSRALAKDAIETHLRHAPKKESKSRIKRLRGVRRPQYRLMADELRIFYDVREETVEVLAIVPKSQASAWLAQMGEPT